MRSTITPSPHQRLQLALWLTCCKLLCHQLHFSRWKPLSLLSKQKRWSRSFKTHRYVLILSTLRASYCKLHILFSNLNEPEEQWKCISVNIRVIN